MPDNIQNALLAGIISALDGVADAHHKAWQENRKRKQVNADIESRKRQRLGVNASSGPSMEVDNVSSASIGSEDKSKIVGTPMPASTTKTPPSILDHLTFGINEVTKLLENTAKTQRQAVSSTTVEASVSYPPSLQARLVAVCLADVNPPILIGHLPNLVAACNSTRRTTAPGLPAKTWLVPLPKGSEQSLATAMGLKRAAVIALDVCRASSRQGPGSFFPDQSTSPHFSSLQPLLDAVPVLTAPWLRPGVEVSRALVPTHIKQLKTSAPKDMRAAKELRAQGRAAAKQRKKEKAKEIPKFVTISSPGWI